MLLAELDVWFGKFATYICMGLAGLSLALGVGWYVSNLKLDAERKGRKADTQKYVAAQAQATVLAYQQKIAQEQKDRQRADQADAAYANLLSKYNASLLRYASAQGSAHPPSMSKPPSNAQGSDGPSGDSFVSIPMNDARICAVNTARLQALHDWAISKDNTNASKEGVVQKDDQLQHQN